MSACRSRCSGRWRSRPRRNGNGGGRETPPAGGAKIIAAEGELQASVKLGEAATVMATSPGALQLRQLQTMVEISAEKNSTIIFPIPIELLEAFQTIGRLAAGPQR